MRNLRTRVFPASQPIVRHHIEHRGNFGLGNISNTGLITGFTQGIYINNSIINGGIQNTGTAASASAPVK